MLLFWLPLAVLPSLLSLTFSQSFDPDSVPLATREQWCDSQTTQCPLICLQTKNSTLGTEVNDCDPETLTYDCTCSNGISPNATEYSQTLPYYICTEANNQCVANCGAGNNECASDCRQDNPCGAQNPTRVTTTTTSSVASSTLATSSAASAASDSPHSHSTSTTSTSSSSSAATPLVLNIGDIYGLSIVLAAIFAGFAVIL